MPHEQPLLLDEALRESARQDPELFARVALPHSFRLPPAVFHRELIEWHLRMGRTSLAERRGLRFALAAPRGFAKSSVASFLLVLHDIFYARERYIVLVSATQRQAQQRLRALRGELLPGRSLVDWFGWDKSDVEASAGVIQARDTRIEAYGAEMEMRGISHDSWRPTKIILDDAESSASVHSPRRRAALADWFAEVVEHLGGPYTHLLVVGTVLHPAGLLATLMDRPDFTARRCSAIMRFADSSPDWDQWRAILTDASVDGAREQAREFFLARRDSMLVGSEVLWPEYRDYEDLSAQLHLQGRRAFYQEMQNTPLGPEGATFDPTTIRRTIERAGEIHLVAPGAAIDRATAMVPIGKLRRFGYLDSALGRTTTRGGDFAALATIDLAPSGLMMCRKMWIRRAGPSQQIAALFDLHEERAFECVGIEGTGFQELMHELIKTESDRRRSMGRPADIPTRVDRPTAPKPTRIATLEPLFTSGRLALDESLPEELWEELANYPRSAHDDALDALAGAVKLARDRAGQSNGSALSIATAGRRQPRGL